MKAMSRFASLVLSIFVVASGAGQASLIGFVGSPTTNSADWTTDVLSRSGVINTNVNFNAHATGALNPNFYAISDGVTLTPTGDVNTVLNGAGPADGNTFSAPLSSGEGLHPSSNYLFDGGSVSNLLISFNGPVLGVGLFVIDYFNPTGSNPLTIEAFTGINGTGTSLGSFSSVAFNFQNNNLYFMGVVSTAGDIRSVRFTDVNTSTGDTTGIDDIRFATGGGVRGVPEPGTLAMGAMAAIVGLACSRRGRKSAVLARA